MPLQMAPDSLQIPIMPSFYPATTKQAAGVVDGTPTDVTSTYFSDRIMITITQAGRLAQWVLRLLQSRISRSMLIDE